MSRLWYRSEHGVELISGAPVVVGRDPSRPDHDPCAVIDPWFSVSRNHLTVEPVSSQIVIVTDLGSTNGSAVLVEAVAVPLEPEEPTHLVLPCRLLVGECVVDIEPI